MNDAVAERKRWAALELAAWRGVRIGTDALRTVASDIETVALFEIDAGHVRFDPSTLGPGALAESRAALYAGFLEEVLRSARIEAHATLAIGLHDQCRANYRAPVFEFQKVRGAASILLPDVDLIGFRSFDYPDFVDTRPFADKAATACFVGATTGAIITADVVRALTNPRLRSAVRFRDVPEVTFELPTICQCDSTATEAMVRALGTSGPRRSWREQFEHRYLLSMDGNGATCSRVAVALASESVLVKRASANMLYYFHGLEPWVHYLPIRDDEQLIALVRGAGETVARDEAVAAAATAFSRKQLGWEAVVDYTAELLCGYFTMAGAPFTRAG